MASEAGPVPRDMLGAVDSAGKPINLQTWYENRGRRNPDIVKKVVYGKSRYGQDLVAYKVTANAHTRPTAPSPSSGTSPPSTRASGSPPRSNGGCSATCSANRTDSATDIPALLRDTEMWFVPMVNPDGYDWTFGSQNTRLWRKNLRDNDDDGEIADNDGVDPNRNWADEVALGPGGRVRRLRRRDLPRPAAQLRARGAARSTRLIAKLKPKFLIDYHSFGR